MQIQDTLKVSVLAMEFPGYGFFQYQIRDKAQKTKKLECNSKDIATNAKAVYSYVVSPPEEGGLGYKEENTVVYGRSMGTGPASLLAAENKPRGLILVSAYTTIREVAQSVTRKWIGWVVSEHFNNRKSMAMVRCPVLMIHGEKDPLIPVEHSRELFKIASEQQSGTLGEWNVLKTPPNMTHNEFNFQFDLMQPTCRFYKSIFGLYKPS
uniref:Uncharacterized protein n=1 Tax=Strombidium inclinatum TaxID=197538 RepID=A0A7S3INY0_9SPIT|mmetsp:Transcript_30917/g.47290  ORF Transcript_30917/g.47290 Transcript_30917/m.47290 type:complete len:209 (+) Transcript_30917:337-963(+)